MVSVVISVILTTVVVTLAIFIGRLRKRRRAGMSFRSEHVIVFTRYPEPGTTKTRLIPDLGEAAAATLQLCLTNHILEVLQLVQAKRPWVSVEIKYTGGSRKQVNYWLSSHRRRRLRCRWSEQTGLGLGERIVNAFHAAFARKKQRVILIGSDIPAIDADTICSTFDKLSLGTCNMILGPAKDGGYYLVGLSQNEGEESIDLNPLFMSSDIEWGTGKVLQQQRKVAQQCQVRLEILPRILQDVDTIEDLVEIERSTGYTVDQIRTPFLSVIIPVFNEAPFIQQTLQNVTERCSFPDFLEIIVCDGGSEDNTQQLVTEFAENNKRVPIKLVTGLKGRGRQLNKGAMFSKGDNFLFLHADTKLPQGFDASVVLTLSTPGVSAGAFEFSLDCNHCSESERSEFDYSKIFEFEMKVLEWGTNMRAKRFELPYGDQALFMSRAIFKSVAMFPDYLIMEDYEMVCKLQGEGHIQIVEGKQAITSSRRYARHGYLMTVVLNSLIIMAYNLGIHPNALARLYYGRRLYHGN
ncbi:uncharacterized protein LOC121410582 [Lytechinus variegatus]|uniref:uncharacterized protein LOC121410582 n=1 Tax=Lytechinus variegatus TaxID=7654 RepID=UPI001BB1D9E4|nr:uncharacterized protein LOC121410582 [Lytechinus variegatus]